MSGEVVRADVIDRAIDGDPVPNDSEVTFAQEVTQLARGLQLEVERAATVWERIRATPARSEPLSRFGFIHLLSFRRRTALVGMAAVLVVVAIVVSATAPTDAKELLAKVELGAIDPSAVGLARYAGELHVSSWISGDGTRPNVPISFNEVISFESPNRLRLEITSAQANGAPPSVVIATDTATWLWTPATHTAIRLGTVPLGTLAFLAGSEAETALTGASRDYAVARDGTETLAGRAADRVVLTPLPGSAVAGRLGKTTLTLDHQYAVPLAGRILDPSGGSLFEWTFVKIDFAPSFDPAAFVFTPPADAITNDRVSTPALGIDGPWGAVARAVSFRVFRPTFTSSNLQLGYPSRDQDRLVVTYRSSTDLGAVLIIESAGSAGPGPGERVALPGGGSGLYWNDGARQHIVLNREGTRIEVQASLNVSRDDVVKIAGSLVAVSR